MSILSRRDFLLTATSIATAPLLLSAEDTFAQTKNLILRTPQNQTSFLINEPVVLKTLSKTQYPRYSRIDFKANGQLIGQGTWRNPQISWTPTQTGDYTITAEAFSVPNNDLVATATANVCIMELLYDKVGGPGNWGFDQSQGVSGYYKTWFGASSPHEFDSATLFLGTLSEPKTLKRIEVIMDAYNTSTGQEFNLGNLLNFQVRIWNENIVSFFADASTGSLSNTPVGAINFGNVNIPVGTKVLNSGKIVNVYHVGWDNLDIVLPSNVPLQLTTIPEIVGSVNIGEFHGSNFIGSNMLGAARCFACNQTNFTIGQPICAKLSVI